MTREGKPRVESANGARGAGVASPREMLTVDLRGLKAQLLVHCAASGLTASAVMRDALVSHLASAQQDGASPPGHGGWPGAGPEPLGRASCADVERDQRTRLSLRMSLADANELHRRARAAGLSLAGWVLHHMQNGHVPISAEQRASRIVSLTRSNAELATLVRNFGHLNALLRQGEVRAAQEYRQMLDTVAADVRQHLKLAAHVLSTERMPARPGQAPIAGEDHD